MEIKRKYPDISLKAADSNLWNSRGTEFSFENFFPSFIVDNVKQRELRNGVKKQFIVLEAEGELGGCAARAALSFLKIVKNRLFIYDREEFHIKIGKCWSPTVSILIGRG